MIGIVPENIMNSLLETIPIEFSILDKDDNVVGWNKHDTRIFKRPESVVGKNVRNCHPKKSLSKVERILEEMKEGSRDKARFWIDLNLDSYQKPQKILIEYYALRDKKGNYLGCLEASQNITEIQQLSSVKRLLD